MPTGALTSHIDVAQVTLYAFWLFFAGLIFYLRREDRREGYPLESDVNGKPLDHGAIWIPEPKTFYLPHGGTVSKPDYISDSSREFKAVPAAGFSGAPFVPTGDPLVDGVGPAAYALRSDHPDLTHEGEIKILPLRKAPEFSVAEEDLDPRGFPVEAADRKVVGTLSEIWVDRSEHVLRYFEVKLNSGRSVLLPANYTDIRSWGKKVIVGAITAAQFEKVPATKNPDQVTLREEDRIQAYYAGGKLYAFPSRSEPLL